MQTTLFDTSNLFRLVQFFDILSAVVFAVSGALVASRKGMDVMGFMWLAVITGVGGGTVRDVILNVPVFWVQNPVHVSDRKSTRLNSSHLVISYAVFCLKKKITDAPH